MIELAGIALTISSVVLLVKGINDKWAVTTSGILLLAGFLTNAHFHI